MLRSEEKERYERQLLLAEFQEGGQEKLKEARVLLVGCGGLGSPVALYLAAAGVGTLGLLDSDVVELSNLQRQILHTEASLGEEKVTSAQRRLSALNGGLELVVYPLRLTEENASELVEGYDVVVGACDNYATRFYLNQACVKKGIPWVHGAVSGWEGQLSIFAPHHTGGCYQCLVPEIPSYVPSKGIVGVSAGIVGAWQALEVLKLLLGCGELAVGKLWTMDFLRGRVRTLALRVEEHCPCCGRAKGA